jgi:hypothetical protein
MAVSSNLMAPILVSCIVWLLVAAMLVFPIALSPLEKGNAVIIGVMLVLTLINIVMFLV